MTSTEFCAKYNVENSMILLEGKRNVLESDKAKINTIWKIIGSKPS